MTSRDKSRRKTKTESDRILEQRNTKLTKKKKRKTKEGVNLLPFQGGMTQTWTISSAMGGQYETAPPAACPFYGALP